MKVQIIGDGSFGTFLKEFMAPKFEIVPDAYSVILAVPISAYSEIAKQIGLTKHLINVCSVQVPSARMLKKHCRNVTSLHPLFGRRTPSDKRHLIVTDIADCEEANVFDELFSSLCSSTRYMSGEEHDRIMSKTHLAAMLAAKQLQPFIDRAKDVPDELVPNSFRLMREFCKTMEDMPKGTVESILANEF